MGAENRSGNWVAQIPGLFQEGPRRRSGREITDHVGTRPGCPAEPSSAAVVLQKHRLTRRAPWSRRSQSTASVWPFLLACPIQTPRPCRSRDATSAPPPAAAVSFHKSAPRSRGATPVETAAKPPGNIPGNSGPSGSSDGEPRFPSGRLPHSSGKRIGFRSAGCQGRDDPVEYQVEYRVDHDVDDHDADDHAEYSVDYPSKQFF